MRDRNAVLIPFAALAGALGLCCGLPVLLSLGVLGAVGGVSLQNWALLAGGVVLAVAGWARWTRRRAQPSHSSPEPSPHGLTNERTERTRSEEAR